MCRQFFTSVLVGVDSGEKLVTVGGVLDFHDIWEMSVSHFHDSFWGVVNGSKYLDGGGAEFKYSRPFGGGGGFKYSPPFGGEVNGCENLNGGRSH